VNAEQGGEYLGTAAWYEREAKGRDFPFPRLFGQLGAEYMRRFEIPKDEYEKSQAYLADLMYRNARRNPRAQTRGWAMDVRHAAAEDEFNLRISPEVKLSDCSQVTDGAVAIVLASEDYASEYARKHGIPLEDIPAILGWGHTTAPIRLADKLEESRDQKYVLPHARNAITSAYRRAGIDGHDQIDACEFHDCFTTTAYASVDLVGLTPPGENHKAIEEGWLEMEGRLPLNPSGGLIGVGHPVGATGVRQVLEAHRLTTDQAGDYQVRAEHRRVLTVNIGGSGTTTVAFVVGKA
jgi:acetyl-CoA C-acetyltransferase